MAGCATRLCARCPVRLARPCFAACLPAAACRPWPVRLWLSVAAATAPQGVRRSRLSCVDLPRSAAHHPASLLPPPARRVCRATGQVREGPHRGPHRLLRQPGQAARGVPHCTPVPRGLWQRCRQPRRAQRGAGEQPGAVHPVAHQRRVRCECGAQLRRHQPAGRLQHRAAAAGGVPPAAQGIGGAPAGQLPVDCPPVDCPPVDRFLSTTSCWSLRTRWSRCPLCFFLPLPLRAYSRAVSCAGGAGGRRRSHRHPCTPCR